jgi:hypothetical protein
MSDLTNTLSRPGDVDVKSAKIITTTGKVIDIIGMIAEISIYEDIFSNTISGHLLLEDSLDLINTLPLVGEEQFELSLLTPTLTVGIAKTFYVYKLQSLVTKKRSQTFMLNFCSRELIFSANSKVSKAFSGNITDTVVSIFRDPRYLGSTSELFVDKTKNSYSFIAPYWSPIETINWLTGKSINERGVPNFLFYETNKSFEYVSVDTLIQSGVEREYIFSDVDSNTAFGVGGNKEDKYSIVESMDTAVTFDYLRNLNAGMYSSKLYTMDLTTRNINTNTFDYIDDFSKSSHLNTHPLRTSDLVRKKVASLYFIEKNNYQTGALKKQGYSDFFLQRNSLLEQLSAFKICIKVFGRTDMKVGAVVKFTINEMRQILADEIDTKGTSEYFSGRYLVTAIKHQIINGRHSMYMEIVSDSFVKQLLSKVG